MAAGSAPAAAWRARSTRLALASVLLVALLGPGCARVAADASVNAATSDRARQLVARSAKAADGVIPFTSADFERFAAAGGRDYTLVFFLNSRQMAGSATMKLPALRAEFALTAQAFKRGEDAERVHFVELLFEASKDVFQRLGVKQLPYMFMWGPAATTKEGRTIKLAKSSRCGPSISTYPWPAEELVSCVAGATGLHAGEVDRPSVLKHPLFPLALLGFIVAGGAAAWRVYNSPLVRITQLWMIGALLVYWFATSGGMYNIIRGIPLFYRDRDSGKVVFWMEGRQGQLGMEGFIMGTSYLLFSSTLASLTYVVPRIRSDSARALTSTALVLLAGLLGSQILSLYEAKSGLRMRSFLW